MVVELKITIDRLPLKRLRSVLSQEALLVVLKDALDWITVELMEDFELGVRTWERQPVFQREVKKIEKGVRAEIFTTDRIYRYVSEGTPPHPIPSEGISARPMPVAPTGMPKTQPGRLYSIPGYKPPPEGFARSVSHPGIRPRKFPEQIKRLRQKQIVGYISDQLGRRFRAALKG